MASGPNPAGMPPDERPQVNDEIHAPQVRLIDQNGEMVGVVGLREAQKPDKENPRRTMRAAG
jgi:translation initiation factor IF-3